MHFKLDEEQKEIKKAVRAFCKKEFTPEMALEFDDKEEFPSELYKKAAKLGFTGLRIPERYDGQGYGLFTHCLSIEEMCRIDPGLGVAVSFGNLMVPEVLLKYGSEKQKEKYIPPLARGDATCAAAFSEPEHGSDITQMDTVARKTGDVWVMNGSKEFITNAPIANTFIVLCQTNLEAKPPHRGQSIFLLEKGTPGMEATKLKGKMGIRPCVTGSLGLSDVKIPEQNLVGELNKGFYYALELFNETRIAVAAQAVGMAQGAFELAFNYAKNRKQFGSPIIAFQGVSFNLAEMAIKIQAARLLIYDALIKSEKKGAIIAKEAAMAKKFANEMAVWVCDQAIQLHGAYGYTADYEVERYYRDVRGWSMGGGTTQICLNRIAQQILKG